VFIFSSRSGLPPRHVPVELELELNDKVHQAISRDRIKAPERKIGQRWRATRCVDFGGRSDRQSLGLCLLPFCTALKAKTSFPLALHAPV
jgi:hypothetical protein